MPKGKYKTSGDGQPHYWRLDTYEIYVSRGVCDCGAIKFFANDLSKQSQQRAEYLTQKKGKKGCGHRRIL
uniref:Uncharacterized protein n=1 Tax=viral metagenome TaxID=1070528 RepID=A0A6M3LFN1_9ZZZZ